MPAEVVFPLFVVVAFTLFGIILAWAHAKAH
jgi:hypothetical protein